jgi:hypothetical protein
MSVSMASPDLDDPHTLGLWADRGFDEATARAWLAAAPGRFTPWTARQWAAEGFWPHDAAVWSEAFADPRAARERRSFGYGPFDETE